MYKVRLANGAEYPVHWCGGSGGSLSIALPEGELPTLAQVFGDPEATKVIEFVSDHNTTIYDNYTRLVALIDERWQGMYITITLRQEG